jgi:hypothetical protein
MSGQPLRVNWVVENRGIGVTNTESWGDSVFLATDAAGTQIAHSLGSFSHIGKIAAGLSYERSVDVAIPNGVTGEFFLVVKTGGPFEFVHTNNNQRVLGPITVTLSPSPDLAVTEIVAPTTALEGDLIDISWTVSNNGQANAGGAWTDIVYLKRIDIANGPTTTLGQFTYDRGLAAGTTYSRTERFQLPAKIQGIYQIVVATNTGRTVFELGAAANNNSLGDDQVCPTASPPAAPPRSASPSSTRARSRPRCRAGRTTSTFLSTRSSPATTSSSAASTTARP